MDSPGTSHGRLATRLAAFVASAAFALFGLAYAFALVYRRRAGLPHPRPLHESPAAAGLPFESVTIPSGVQSLAGWFVPAPGFPSAAGDGTAGRAGIVVVHGWESNRGRSLAHARYLHAAGFHVLVFDVRGHGDNAPETLPIGPIEFGIDAGAAARWLAARPGVTGVGILGHSYGAAGALLAAADEPAIAAVATMSAPGDPVRLTRETFRFAGLPLPGPLALPLAWLTARVVLAPRRHRVDDASPARAAARFRGPLLLVHGEQDRIVPVDHLDRIVRAAQSTSRGRSTLETLVVPDYGHRWLYEVAACRRAIAGFFARALPGAPPAAEAADLAAACAVERPTEIGGGFGAWPTTRDRLDAATR